MLKKNFDCSNAANFTRFLRAFYKENEPIHIRAWGEPNDRTKPPELSGKVPFTITQISENYNKWRNNSIQNRIAYFFNINSGGICNKKINKINAHFIEVDDAVKAEQWKRINEFPLPPSIVVETQKSLHIYWLMKDGADVKAFQKIQRALIQFFKSDGAIQDLARCMRLPGFFHWKTGSPVEVICPHFDPELRYTQAQLLEVLEKLGCLELDQQDMHGKKQCSKAASQTIHFAEGRKNTISTKQLILSAKTKFELLDALNHVSMSTVANLPQSGNFRCVCPEHEDVHPSARIFHTPDGIDLYRCFGCRTTMANIELLKMCRNISTDQAMRLILNVVKIKQSNLFKESEYIQQSDFLASEKCVKLYPVLYEMLKLRLPYLQQLFLFAVWKSDATDFHYTDDGLIFAASYDQLLNWFSLVDRNSVHHSLALFSLLRIIEKMDEEDIPEKLLDAALEKKQNELHKLIGFYKIPKRTALDFSSCEQAARKLSEIDFRSGSLNQCHIRFLFGKQEAKRVYPSVNGNSTHFFNKMQQAENALVTLMEKQKHVSFAEVSKLGLSKKEQQTLISACMQRRRWQKHRVSRSLQKHLDSAVGLGKNVLISGPWNQEAK